MGRERKVRRQSHGAAWHWKQTDSWYYTMPGTKKRVALFDKDGQRISLWPSARIDELLARLTASWAQHKSPHC